LPTLLPAACVFLLAVPSAYTNGWQGWPVPTNASWYGYQTNHYFAQLWSGLVERCDAAGAAYPSAQVDTYTVPAGFSNIVTTNGGALVTNWFPIYTTVAVTNQFLPFTYSYSNAWGSGSNTCNPYLRRSWFTAWDAKALALIPSFLDDTRMSNGTFNAWFLSTNGPGTGPTTFPAMTATGLFARAPLGFVTNGATYFTQHLAFPTSDIVLASFQWRTNGWWTAPMAPYSTNVFLDTERPRIEFVESTGPTNPWPAFTVTVSGLQWVASTRAVSATTETFTVTSPAPVASTTCWYQVQSATYSTNSLDPATNATWRLVYPAWAAVHAPVHLRLYSIEFNERRTLLQHLGWTSAGEPFCRSMAPVLSCWWSGERKAAGTNASLEGCKAVAVADYSQDAAYGTNTHWYPWVGNYLWGTANPGDYQVWLSGIAYSNWFWFTACATGKVKGVQLYLCGQAILADAYSAGHNGTYSTNDLCIFDSFGWSNLVFGSYSHVGTASATTNAVDDPALVFDYTPLAVVTNPWTTTPPNTGGNPSTRGFRLRGQSGGRQPYSKAAYSHTNWYSYP
jgi:hypothetical protein